MTEAERNLLFIVAEVVHEAIANPCRSVDPAELAAALRVLRDELMAPTLADGIEVAAMQPEPFCVVAGRLVEAVRRRGGSL